MLKTVLIFLIGTFCGFWFSWLVPRGLVDYFKGSGHHTNKTSPFEERDKEFHKNEVDVLEKQMINEVTVLCMVMTYPENHYRATNIKATWGKRCDGLLFFSTTANDSIPIIALSVKEGENFEWERTKESFKYVYYKFIKKSSGHVVDWVMKVDDETYVVVENLKYLLSSYNPNEALYFGRYIKPNSTPTEFETETNPGYMDGEAGYVLSTEAVRKFVVEGLEGKKTCQEDEMVEDDLEMGKCMDLLKVKPKNSKDSMGRGRFFPLKPSDHVFEQLKSTFWNITNHLFTYERGLDCCSDLAITFHQIRTSYMYTLEYFLYHLHPYGFRHNTTARLNLDTPVGSNNSSFID